MVGDVKLVSAAVFDVGVYLLVIGVVIMVLGHLASRTHGAAAGAECGMSLALVALIGVLVRHRRPTRCCTAA